jgi:hypothetical protein
MEKKSIAVCAGRCLKVELIEETKVHYVRWYARLNQPRNEVQFLFAACIEDP